MPGAILASAESPAKLEEFVRATVPPLSEEGYTKVVDILEIQRGYIEAHLKTFNATHENWHRFAQNLWNSLPTRLMERVADAVTYNKRVTTRAPDPVPTVPATDDNPAPTPAPVRRGRPPSKAKADK